MPRNDNTWKHLLESHRHRRPTRTRRACDRVPNMASPRDRAIQRLVLVIALLCALAVPARAGYEEGRAAYQRGDYATAVREWRPLAERGDADAQYALGVMYHYGAGASQDYAEAARWYRLAAAQGDANAQFNLGVMYYKGEGVAVDLAEARRWYQAAAD